MIAGLNFELLNTSAYCVYYYYELCQIIHMHHDEFTRSRIYLAIYFTINRTTYYGNFSVKFVSEAFKLIQNHNALQISLGPDTGES